MNKLVSRNPVQRFKQGRKIVKALKGTQFGRNVQIVYYTGRDGKDYEAFYNPQAKKWMYANRGQKNYQFMPEGYTTHDGYNFNGDFAIVSNQKNKQGVQKSFINKQQKNLNKTSQKKNISNSGPLFGWKWGENNYEGSSIKPRNLQQTTNKLVDASPIVYYDNNVNKFYQEDTNPNSGVSAREVIQPTPMPNIYYDNIVTTTKQSNPSSSIPINNVWLKGYKHDEVKDVKAMQNELIKLGLLKDRFGADGKWGENTEKAYQLYLSMNNAPQYEKPEFISPAAQIGVYSTENNTSFNQPLYQRIRFKLGGILPSRNIVRRFKNRKFN